MLSLRRRHEEGRAAGFRGMADDVELEEGEACSDDDGGGLGFVDPDVALAYIDEKLQHVLGHFQKDFEGGVSAEKLGPKFGGYGSFLPTQQRSPTPLPQSRRSSPMVAKIGTPRSPYQMPAEILDHNSSAVAVESISQNNGIVAPSSGDLCKNKICSSTNGEKDSVAPSDSLDNPFNDSGQNAMKVRIRVGSNNALVKKKASIYSGLGLDISSSSSMEGSPDGLEGLSPEFSNLPYESPRTILQIMTCFSIPGGFLLSPLHGNVLQLTNKVAPLLKKWGQHLDVVVPSVYEVHSEPALHSGRFRGQISKKKKSESKKRKSINTYTRNDIADTNSKEVKMEMSTREEIILGMPVIPSFSGVSTTELKRVSQCVEESRRNACISRPYERNKDVQLKEIIGSDELATDKAEDMKEEAAKHTKNGSFDKSGTGYRVKGKAKPDRKSEVAIVNSEGDENMKDWDVPRDDLKKAPGKRIFASDRLEGDNYQIEITRMHNEHKINAAAASELLEDNNFTHSSAAVKDATTDSELKSNHFEKKTKAKSHKDLKQNLPIRSQVDQEGDMLENTSAQFKLRRKEKMDGSNENEFDMSVAEKEEIPVSIKHGKFLASEEQELHVPSNISITATNTVPLPAPVVIEENWVCCDMCQKWRLLPYGTNPSMLPKKWKCSMLYWLPGMNKCEIGEEETTDALNALYVTQVPATRVSSCGPHTVAAATTASNSYNISGQLEQSRKRKITLKDGNGSVESFYPTPSSIPLTSNQDSTKNKRTVDSEHYPFERDYEIKRELGSVSTSANFVVENQKLKLKSPNSYSDEGEFVEKSKKHAKFESKRGIDQDEKKTSKKIKKVDQHNFGSDTNHECDLTGGNVPRETKNFPAKEKTIKSSGEQGDISFHKEKVSSRYDLLEKTKKIDDEDAAFREKKEHHENVERLVSSSKKTVAKESEKIQQYLAEHTSKGDKNENLKVRNPKIMTSNEHTSKVDTRSVKVRGADTVLSSAEGYLNDELVADNKYVTAKEVPSELWENLPPRQALELSEHNRRPDVANLQTSTAATSSSSKISNSRRNKNSREAKGSPVESVSSSPLRNINIEKISRGRITGKDGSLIADSCINSGIKVGELYDGKQARNCCESQATGEPLLLHGNKQPKVSFRKEKSQPSIDNNSETRKHIVAQVAHSHLKDGKSQVHSTPVKSDTSKMKSQSRRSSGEIGYQHGIMKQAISNSSDTASPVRMDNNLVAFALKEARDLKHMANHLKNKGQVLESTGLYFEAALKFLHVASLLETPSIDSLRQADVAQSMKMYSETAKLCDFCAHAYERCNETASAALAYKCVEVAYLKAAYYKHPSASKDRQQLQAVVQIAPGESPSSSASDIDNLNSHGLSKAHSTKGRNSPHVAGNLLPLAVRNQAHLLRLLAYTNDVNCAFDATRKSQIAITSSAGNHEGGKHVDAGLNSVRTVLDLNFNNVDELLRLVRLSMESIGS